MASPEGPVYEFGPFRLDARESVLFRQGRPVDLTPKAFDILLALVTHHGHLITKDELMQRIWPDTVVEENNLTQNISMLRRVLADGTGPHHYIETVPKRGYRFTTEVRTHVGEPSEVRWERRTRWQMTTVEEETMAAPKMRARQITVAALLLLGAVGLGLYALRRPERAPETGVQSRHVSISRITRSGHATSAAVSADGRYVAHTLNDGARQGLWIKQAATLSSVPIVRPAAVEYWGMTFSPDGNYIYYVSWTPNRSDAELYRVPVVGGTPQQLDVSDIGTPVAFSPTGAEMAYLLDVSSYRPQSQLIVTDRDGSGRRVLAARWRPDSFAMRMSGPAWSPDGSTIACAARVPGTNGREQELVAVRVADGVQESIGNVRWFSIGRIAWLRDGSGLLVTAQERRWSPAQIWHVTYPGGEPLRLTNDLNDYSDLGLTGESHTAVAIRTERIGAIWVTAATGTRHATRTLAEVGPDVTGIGWTPARQIVYPSNANGNWDAWVMESDGTQQRQLTFDSHNEIHPSVSPDGRHVVFSSDRRGPLHVWRTELDTGRSTQLTDGDDGVFPQVSADGRWVVYQQGYGWFKPLTLWKVPLEGGSPVQLTTQTSMRPSPSPDGNRIAFFQMNGGQWSIAIKFLDREGPTTTLSIAPTSSRVLRWQPDGRAVTYVVTSGGVSNIWSQPLGGGPAQRVTDFASEEIFDFAWSPDGELLALLRGFIASDVVSIRLGRES